MEVCFSHVTTVSHQRLMQQQKLRYLNNKAFTFAFTKHQMKLTITQFISENQ